MEAKYTINFTESKKNILFKSALQWTKNSSLHYNGQKTQKQPPEVFYKKRLRLVTAFGMLMV